MARRLKNLEPIPRKTTVRIRRKNRPGGAGLPRKARGRGSMYGPWAPGQGRPG